MTLEEKREYQRRWVAANPEKKKASADRYRAKHKDRWREYARRTRAKYPQKWRDYHLKSKYGITIAERDAMILEQGGKCAICKDVLNDPHIDHQSNPHKVRGILCHNCNVSLGLLKDSSAVCRAAAEYLERHEK